MENLTSPWGLPPPAYAFHHNENRTRFGSTLNLRETCPPTAQQNLLPRRQRSPSLPPISTYHITPEICEPKGQDFKKQEGGPKSGFEDVEGETSGYASDSVAPHSSPEYWQKKQYGGSKSSRDSKEDHHHLPAPVWHQSARSTSKDDLIRRWSEGVASSSEDQRPRWGDKGLGAGKLWEPHDPEARLPQVATKGTPAWIERTLNMIDHGDSQILVIDQQSNHSSDTSEYKTMSDQHEKNTYLLGQNVPIEPNIKAEREFKRLKALELQAAIVQQLEERERQKRDERERKIREEKEEDERFRRQQDLERQRLEEERRIIEEKHKREQRRAEALRVALERAEQQAKLEKENKKNKRLRENFEAMNLRPNRSYEASENAETQKSSAGESKLIQNIYIEQSYTSGKKTHPGNNKLFQNTDETNVIVSNPQIGRLSRQSDTNIADSQSNESNHNKKIETPRKNQSDSTNTMMHTSQTNAGMVSLMPEAPMSLVQIPISQDTFAPINFVNGGSVQMALLVPQTNVYPCIHQPFTVQALFPMETSNQSKISSTISNNYQIPSQTDTDDCMSIRDRGSRVLTPSKYRNPNYRDASTQTDAETVSLKNIGIEETAKSALSNLEASVEHNTSDEKLNSLKKDRRLNSEERNSNKDLENRPKWGVNKPPTQYKKQSEKDIFYTQKRKLRQRKRAQEKLYTSHSSDDNRSPSPSKISNDQSRVSLSDYHWRKKGIKSEKLPYPGNMSVETTQILPLECDQSGVVHVGESLCFRDEKKTFVEKKPPSSKRGITLTQKFMNDKYGNPKMWQDSFTSLDAKHKYEEDINIRDKLENRKKYMDSLNIARREQSNHYEEEESNQPIVLDQLRSLRDSLKKQQQIWGKYEKDRRSQSPKNEVDLEME